MITASEHFLKFEGTSIDALAFVRDMRDLGVDFGTTFADFLFNIETALQHEGLLDEHFNEAKP